MANPRWYGPRDIPAADRVLSLSRGPYAYRTEVWTPPGIQSDTAPYSQEPSEHVGHQIHLRDRDGEDIHRWPDMPIDTARLVVRAWIDGRKRCAKEGAADGRRELRREFRKLIGVPPW